MPENRVIIIGAGVGGLASAMLLSAQGMAVTVVDAAATPGGKMRQLLPRDGGDGTSVAIDGGPTVFTLRDVFEQIFDESGRSFGDCVDVSPLSILARHAWNPSGDDAVAGPVARPAARPAERLDLFGDLDRTVDEISRLSGPDEGRRYAKFCADTKRLTDTLEYPMLRSPCPSMTELPFSLGARGFFDLARISRIDTLWQALGRTFKDPRLRQLFGRYATYCGSSPFKAPAPLMVIAHVERDGVWAVKGGMHALARAMMRVAEENGAVFRFNSPVTRIKTRNGHASGAVLETGEELNAESVIFNGDFAALSSGLLGDGVANATPRASQHRRSLSAVTWALHARTSGFPLTRHNVFFDSDYQSEFKDVFERQRLPQKGTVYICAQDRDDAETPPDTETERLLCLVNAPPTGDTSTISEQEIAQCQERMMRLLDRCGLSMSWTAEDQQITGPQGFHRLFPATGGALYGQSSHGMLATFQRPGARTKIPGLYLAGGSVHPGPGVPMAATSGRLAAMALLADHQKQARVSTSPSPKMAMSGGISTG